MARSWIDEQDPETWGKGLIVLVVVLAIGLLCAEMGTGKDETVLARVTGRDYTEGYWSTDTCTDSKGRSYDCGSTYHEPDYTVYAVAEGGEDLRIDVNPGVYQDAADAAPLVCNVHTGGLFHSRTASFLRWGQR